MVAVKQGALGTGHPKPWQRSTFQMIYRDQKSDVEGEVIISPIRFMALFDSEQTAGSTGTPLAKPCSHPHDSQCESESSSLNFTGSQRSIADSANIRFPQRAAKLFQTETADPPGQRHMLVASHFSLRNPSRTLG